MSHVYREATCLNTSGASAVANLKCVNLARVHTAMRIGSIQCRAHTIWMARVGPRRDLGHGKFIVYAFRYQMSQSTRVCASK